MGLIEHRDAKSCTALYLCKFDDEVQVPQCEAGGLVCRQVVHGLAKLVCISAGVIGSALVYNGDCVHVQ